MSLEELLASYGVSTSELNISIPTNQNSARPRTSRAGHRRSAGASTVSSNSETVPVLSTTENSLPNSEDLRNPSSASPVVKRSRRSNASPSPDTPNATESVHEQDPLASKRKFTLGPISDRLKEVSKESSVPDVRESGVSHITILFSCFRMTKFPLWLISATVACVASAEFSCPFLSFLLILRTLMNWLVLVS